LTRLRSVVVIALLAAWLAPGASAAAQDAECCCPEEMQGACSRKAGCSLRTCDPDDGSALTSGKSVLQSTPALPTPTVARSAPVFSRTLSPETTPVPFDPPPRG